MPLTITSSIAALLKEKTHMPHVKKRKLHAPNIIPGKSFNQLFQIVIGLNKAYN